MRCDENSFPDRESPDSALDVQDDRHGNAGTDHGACSGRPGLDAGGGAVRADSNLGIADHGVRPRRITRGRCGAHMSRPRIRAGAAWDHPGTAPPTTPPTPCCPDSSGIEPAGALPTPSPPGSVALPVNPSSYLPVPVHQSAGKPIGNPLRMLDGMLDWPDVLVLPTAFSRPHSPDRARAVPRSRPRKPGLPGKANVSDR